MRKVEKQMIEAIRERKNFKSGNTEVVHSDSGKYFKVYLFGNMIANGKDCGTVVRFDDCGYRSDTTKSRLNAMIKELPTGLSGGIFQRNGEWYYEFDGKAMEWQGSIVTTMLPNACSFDLV